MSTKFAVFASVLALVPSALAFDILSDGNMDDLDIGTNPDNDKPAGAWHFPQNYLDAGLGEVDVNQFTIVKTADFDASRDGNSLGLRSEEGAGNFHLTNLFNEQIDEAEGLIVEVSFDFFVPKPDIGGGSIYIGGDHGGGGFSNVTDRGPQLSWLSDGTIILSPGDVVIVESYPADEWQKVRLEIDLFHDTFDMYWAAGDDPLALVGSDLEFRSGTLDFLERFSYVHFTGLETLAISYLDNVSIEILGCEPCDTNCDGSVDLVDVASFIELILGGEQCAAECSGDTNDDGSVDLTDVEGFIECLLG